MPIEQLYTIHTLATTVGYELIHATDATSGKYFLYSKLNGGNKEAGKNYSELNAYKWEFDMQSRNFNSEEYQIQLKLKSDKNWKF